MRRSIITVLGLISLSFFGCSSSKVIYNDGLKHLKIGDEMLAEGTRRFKGRDVRDTLLVEQGYSWRGSIIEFSQGRVILEEDFQGKGKINRIRVESSALSFKKTISTRQPASQLLELGKNWDITYLNTYKLLDFNLSRFPTIHFLVKEPQERITKQDFQKFNFEDINSEAVIVSIVVM